MFSDALDLGGILGYVPGGRPETLASNLNVSAVLPFLGAPDPSSGCGRLPRTSGVDAA